MLWYQKTMRFVRKFERDKNGEEKKKERKIK